MVAVYMDPVSCAHRVDNMVGSGGEVSVVIQRFYLPGPAVVEPVPREYRSGLAK